MALDRWAAVLVAGSVMTADVIVLMIGAVVSLGCVSRDGGRLRGAWEIDSACSVRPGGRYSQ